MEDRVVKDYGRRLARDYEFDGPVDVPELRRPRPPQVKILTRKAVAPGEAELRENPRSRSAQMRVLEKLNAAAE
jgi:16S rRNA (cytosine1402-N4)-methyltransferase